MVIFSDYLTVSTLSIFEYIFNAVVCFYKEKGQGHSQLCKREAKLVFHLSVKANEKSVNFLAKQNLFMGQKCDIVFTFFCKFHFILIISCLCSVWWFFSIFMNSNLILELHVFAIKYSHFPYCVCLCVCVSSGCTLWKCRVILLPHCYL